MRGNVELQAHRGVEAYFPGNTMVSFRAAAEQGYDRIELDPALTKDGVIVVLHNKTINATARYADGREIEEPVNIADITYEEALTYDFGVWKGEQFKGEKIPLLKDALTLARDNGIRVKVDNKLARFPQEDIERVFDMINELKADVTISSWSIESAIHAAERMPHAHVSFDGVSDEEKLKELVEAVGKERLEIWLPVEKTKASWAPDEWFATPEKCEIVRKYAELDLWAIGSQEAYDKAVSDYSPAAVETSGIIKPDGPRK